MTKHILEIGQKAPDFTIQTDTNELISLKDFLGKTVILYFYPKDNTPGCTKEACDLRDSFPQFNQKDAVIFGVSKDSVKSHQKFKEKYKLPFTLLADEKGEVCEKYGVFAEKSMFGKTFLGIKRTTFLIDKEGIIQGIWRNVKVDGHAEELLGKVSS